MTRVRLTIPLEPETVVETYDLADIEDVELLADGGLRVYFAGDAGPAHHQIVTDYQVIEKELEAHS